MTPAILLAPLNTSSSVIDSNIYIALGRFSPGAMSKHGRRARTHRVNRPSVDCHRRRCVNRCCHCAGAVRARARCGRSVGSARQLLGGRRTFDDTGEWVGGSEESFEQVHPVPSVLVRATEVAWASQQLQHLRKRIPHRVQRVMLAHINWPHRPSHPRRPPSDQPRQIYRTRLAAHLPREQVSCQSCCKTQRAYIR